MASFYILYELPASIQLPIIYLRAKAMLDQTALYFCSLNYSINGIQTCDLNLSKFESFKLLWKTNAIILDERFSTGGDSGMSGSIWQHLWLSQKGRREILVSGGKRPGILQNIQQCTQQPPTSTEKSIMLRLKNPLDYQFTTVDITENSKRDNSQLHYCVDSAFLEAEV